MKHKASQWYVSTTSSWNVVTRSQKDVTTTSHQCVFTTSETNLKWNTQRPLIGTSLRRLNGMYVSPVSPKWNTQQRCCVTSPPRLRVTLSRRLWYVFKLLCHDLHLVGFHVLFKYQIKHQNFVVPTRRETRRVVWNIN